MRALCTLWRHLAQNPTTPDIHPAPPVNLPTIDAGGYMCMLVKTACNAKLTLLKKHKKAKGGPLLFEPEKSHADCIYVATHFPECISKTTT